MKIPQFTCISYQYISTVGRDLMHLLFWTLKVNASMNMYVLIHFYKWTYAWISSGCIPRRIAKSRVMHIFILSTLFHRIVQNSCTSLHSKERYIRIPVTPHSFQLLPFWFFTFANLLGVELLQSGFNGHISDNQWY